MTQLLHKLKALTSDYKWLSVSLLFCLYAAIFQVFYPVYGNPLSFFILIPVLVAAWLYGLKGSLVASALALAGQILLFHDQGANGVNLLLDFGGLTNAVLTFITVLSVGRLSDVKQMERRTRDIRQQSEAAVSHAEHLSLNAQQKLEAASRKESELLQLRTHLMITISHEFRTPLSIILASTELLDRYFDRLSPTRRAECLTSIKTQVVHLREMLNDITTISSVEGFNLAFHPVPLDLLTLFQIIVDEVQASVGAAYQIALTAEGNLNPIPVDEELIKTILHNLLSNAIKYSPTGSTVHVHLSRKAGEIVFSVKDNGIGIPLGEQNHIFDTFHRASNVSHIGGLGLGLKIVRDFVVLHGGTIHVDSREGQGTTFTIHFPVITA